MKHLLAVFIKLFVDAVLIGIFLNYLTGLSFLMISVIIILVAAITYTVGDLWILPKTNNTIATFSDLIMSFIIIYAFRFFSVYHSITITSALICAALVGISELFFHKYMAISVLPGRRKA